MLPYTLEGPAIRYRAGKRGMTISDKLTVLSYDIYNQRPSGSVDRACRSRVVHGQGLPVTPAAPASGACQVLNRWMGILAFAAMIAANTAVFVQDIVPEWWAGDPPLTDVQTLSLENPERRIQIGIYDAGGRRIGQAWTVAKRSNEVISVSSLTSLGPVSLPGAVEAARIRIDTELTYRNRDSRIDGMRLRVHGLPLPIDLTGEILPSDEFPISYKIGSTDGRLVLTANATRALGDIVRPFDRMRDLYVGQTWRLRLIDPLAHVLNPSDTEEIRFETMLVRVTELVQIEHRGKKESCFLVVAGRSRAWVAEDDGRVLRQEVIVPLFGRLTMLDEPYIEAEYRAAQQNLRMIELRTPDERIH
jgi:hypothetical protein